MPTGAAGPAQNGSLDLFNSFNAFNGMGSYFEGFQAGYNYMLPSRWLFGVEADVSFPSTIAGTSTFSSATTGTASYAEQVEFSGTLRGRIGYAPNLGTTHWLFYATGGFAWSYDQFTRTQIAGTPAGGTAVPGQAENLFVVPRVGGVAGAGVELALPSNWTARLEYLFTDYGNRSVTFPAGAQRFNSDLNVSELRFGLNYKLNGDAASAGNAGIAPPVPEFDNFAIHGQTTYLNQYVFPFRNPYSGQNSLAPNQGRETWDATAFLGMRLWQGAELWVNPEIDQGFGLSSTLGVAGFPSGEAYKVGASVPYARIPRYFVRQTIDLGGDTQKVDGAANQFSGSQTANRLVLTVGKFARHRHFRHQQIRPRSAQRFHELGADRHRHLRLRRRRLGLHLRRRRRVVPGRLDACAAAYSICRSCPTTSSSTRISRSSNGSARSSAAMSCGASRARSRSPDF